MKRLQAETIGDGMDKTKFHGLGDCELTIALSRRGASIAARGWLPVLLLATAALVAIGLAIS
jgi:hypothetical protein